MLMMRFWVSNFEFLEMCKFISGTSIFFATRMSSGGPTHHEIRATKFVGKPNSCAIGWVDHLDFRKFAQKLKFVIGFWRRTCSWVVAGAIFIALRRCASLFIWLDERLACRVIPRRRKTRGRRAAMLVMRFGYSISNFPKCVNSFRVPVFFLQFEWVQVDPRIKKSEQINL